MNDSNNELNAKVNEFFKFDGIIDRCKNELGLFRERIRNEEREKVKDSLNAFHMAFMNSDLPEGIKLEIYLLFLDTLSFYGQQYSNKQTYLNILKSFEEGQYKEKLFSKFPVKSKMVYAETLFRYYTLVKNDEPIFSFEKTDLLIKSKSYLWKVYIHHIDGKNKLSKIDLSHCLTLLAGSLAELSRWFEPLRCLDEAKSQLQHNPNVEYMRAIILDSFKQKTCVNYNGQLLLKIIDSCMESVKFPRIAKEQKEQLRGIETESRAFLLKHKKSIKNLRTHKSKVSKSFNKYRDFKKYCSVNHLFLSEHSHYCNCGQSTKDDFKIKTDHNHTKIEWVNRFEKFIDLLVADFVIARHNYYYSLNDVAIPFFKARNIGRHDSVKSVKNALLKNSFKTLYSLLDQIGHGVFQVMEIDHESKMKLKFPDEESRPKLYFLNMWDYGLF